MEVSTTHVVRKDGTRGALRKPNLEPAFNIYAAAAAAAKAEAADTEAVTRQAHPMWPSRMESGDPSASSTLGLCVTTCNMLCNRAKQFQRKYAPCGQAEWSEVALSQPNLEPACNEE
jgi:hypothetical protein